MVQSYNSGRAFRIGPGSGLSFSNISSMHTKLFCNNKSNDFFLSWRRFVVLTAVTSVSEVIVIFPSANSVCKHSSFLLFSPGISLPLFLRR